MAPVAKANSVQHKPEELLGCSFGDARVVEAIEVVEVDEDAQVAAPSGMKTAPSSRDEGAVFF